MEYKDVTIVIPTLNEEKNIERLVQVLKNNYPNCTIIVSDDGSTDKTLAVAEKQGAKILNRKNEKVHGLCASILDAAKNVTTRYTIVMDADFQHPPEKIKELIDCLEVNDLVVATRIKIEGPWPYSRKLLSKGALLLAKIRLAGKKFRCSDTMSGFFAIQTALFKKTILKHERKYEKKGYKVLFDTLKYLPTTTKVREIPYIFTIRREGDSKIAPRHIFFYLRSLFK